MNKKATENQSATTTQPGTPVKLTDLPTSVQALIALLGVMIKPDLVFMVSPGDGITVPCGLLFVLPDSRQAAWDELQGISELGLLQDPAVHISLVTAGNLHRFQQQGHVYYSFVCRPENLLCGKAGIELELTDIRIMKKLIAQILVVFNSLYHKAQRFKLLAEEQEKDEQMALFLTYQSASLLLRALSMALIDEEPKSTHTIRELMMHNRKVMPQLNTIFNEADMHGARLIDMLDSVHQEGKFPLNSSFPKGVKEQLLEKIGILLETGLRSFEQRLLGYFRNFEGMEVLR